ncbi:MAG TPA: 2-phospho-L-lactate guanylyltransferase [Gammaproteobacteria bacterium]|nr:2-phospho-L-lactate guanylyltransferase [Gammaproteobacteria bacterium]
MWAIIPINNFNESFSRLSNVLNKKQREEMTQILATQVLDALTPIASVEKIIVLSNEIEWLSSFWNKKIVVLPEPDTEQFSEKIDNTAQWIQSQGVTAMLYLSIDLPYIQQEDIENLISQHISGLSIVEAKKDNGTNALILDLPTKMEFQFGPNSFSKHLAEARSKNINTTIVNIECLSLDLDDWNDLHLFKKNSVESKFSQFINQNNF